MTHADIPRINIGKRRGVLDLTGVMIGKLRVIRRISTPSKGKLQWLCECVCGKQLYITHDRLIHTNNPKTHCGCQQRGLPTLHKQEYHIWAGMIARCENPKHVGFPKYGGSGITVCEEWHTFENFLRDMGKRPSKKHSLDRKDGKLGYFPANVQWSTSKEQGRNRWTTIWIPHPDTGVKVPAAQVAEERGITFQQLRYEMIRAGTWPYRSGGNNGEAARSEDTREEVDEGATSSSVPISEGALGESPCSS